MYDNVLPIHSSFLTLQYLDMFQDDTSIGRQYEGLQRIITAAITRGTDEFHVKCSKQIVTKDLLHALLDTCK